MKANMIALLAGLTLMASGAAYAQSPEAQGITPAQVKSDSGTVKKDDKKMEQPQQKVKKERKKKKDRKGKNK